MVSTYWRCADHCLFDRVERSIAIFSRSEQLALRLVGWRWQDAVFVVAGQEQRARFAQQGNGQTTDQNSRTVSRHALRENYLTKKAIRKSGRLQRGAALTVPLVAVCYYPRRLARNHGACAGQGAQCLDAGYRAEPDPAQSSKFAACPSQPCLICRLGTRGP